jgi:hypothetical protein
MQHLVVVKWGLVMTLYIDCNVSELSSPKIGTKMLIGLLSHCKPSTFVGFVDHYGEQIKYMVSIDLVLGMMILKSLV